MSQSPAFLGSHLHGPLHYIAYKKKRKKKEESALKYELKAQV